MTVDEIVAEIHAGPARYDQGTRMLAAEIERLRAENAGTSYALAALRAENASLREFARLTFRANEREMRDRGPDAL